MKSTLKKISVCFFSISTHILFAPEYNSAANLDAHKRLKALEFSTIAQIMHREGALPAAQLASIQDQLKNQQYHQAIENFERILQQQQNAHEQQKSDQ